VAASNGKGRTITLHPQEALLQQARVFQQSEAFYEYRWRRQVSEHRLARLVQLGIRQARYFGRVKTLFQVLLAAAVANLTLVATKLGMMGKRNGRAASFLAALCHRASTIARALVVRLMPLLTALRWSQWSNGRQCFEKAGFRPDS